ncbi:F-box/kelch-repeat protein [Salix suchowensis]|nr:F-box/kelch-repeat protein [Salix suchowensis]
MVGRKRRKVKLLPARVVDDKTTTTTTKNKKVKLETQTWSDLPIELLELILCHLSLEDNIRSSVACKRWNTAAISVRVVNQSPWLMYFPKFGNMYEFYDPAQRKTYSLELPELYGSRVCYTRDGWLLLYRPTTNRVFFFDPFSQEVVKLPRFELTYQIVAFSCAPTSNTCVVFTVRHVSPTIVAISTCHPGATEWVTVNYQNRLPFVSSIWNKIVFCNGFFYCLSLTGWLGVFDPLERTWNVLAVPPPKCPENFFAKNWWKGKFMSEHNGDILVIYTCCSENPIIFKLDQPKMVWREMKTLDGMTLFASFLSSHSRTDLPGMMRNSVYFSKVRFFGKRCISYSLDDCRYYPCKQCYDWGEQDPFENIWIEPPEDLSAFI